MACELACFERVPASTLRERLEKLVKRGLVDTASHHLGALGSRPQRRYFPTEKGVTAAGAATQGRRHMLTTYPVSKQWFRLLAERLDAVAVLYRVAAMVGRCRPAPKPGAGGPLPPRPIRPAAHSVPVALPSA